MSDEQYPVQAPGWAALDKVGLTFYPGQTPHQFTSPTGYDLDSRNPLPAICVWEAANPEHWHYVTYGLTELFEKTSGNPDISGFGFEVTFRIPRQPGQEQPPTWPIELLQTVGHYALSGQGGLDTGHMIDLGGPLVQATDDGDPTALAAVMTVPDPTFGKVDTQFGSVLFLQLFGVTRDELESMQGWPMERRVGFVREVEPFAVTRVERGAYIDDRKTAAAWRRHALGILV